MDINLVLSARAMMTARRSQRHMACCQPPEEALKRSHMLDDAVLQSLSRFRAMKVNLERSFHCNLEPHTRHFP
jgi:hypothetical protein